MFHHEPLGLKMQNEVQTTICNICKNDTHNKRLLRVGDTFSLTLNRDVKFKK